VAAAWPDEDVFCTLGVTNLQSFAVPDSAKVLVVCCENDSGQGARGIATEVQSAVAALRKRCREVVCVWPPPADKDFNDVHQRTPGREGAALIRQHMELEMERRLARSTPSAKRTLGRVVDLSAEDDAVDVEHSVRRPRLTDSAGSGSQ
jgi:hypothetical protein